MAYQTEQEAFWSGDFGDQYIERNACTEEYLASAIGLFSKVLRSTDGIHDVIEFGPNIGLNLKAIRILLPHAGTAAVEINHKAAQQLRNDAFFEQQIQVYEQSVLEYQPDRTYDLALAAGVLIHMHPQKLPQVYETLYRSSKKYICISEYYNPTPVEVSYRGHQGKLFKRDFAGEFLDQYPDCRLADYGFQYHRDRNFPGDDRTWFLLEK